MARYFHIPGDLIADCRKAGVLPPWEITSEQLSELLDLYIEGFMDEDCDLPEDLPVLAVRVLNAFNDEAQVTVH